jgi:hypothetical protein
MLSSKARARLSAALLGLSFVALPAVVVGSQVGSLVQFTSGEVIQASDFNANFDQLRTAQNDTDSRVTALQSQVATLPTASVGPQGPTGPQGPAGPTLVAFNGAAASNPGGSTNAWTPGATLALVQGGPSAALSGQTYSATFRLQTADPVLGGDHAGMPLGAGSLVLDLQWQFTADGGTTRVPVVQTSVATLAVSAAGGNLTVTFSGTVPAAPTTPGGFATTSVVGISILVNGSTTASGQSVSTLALSVP